jgi:hypothetical protein
MTNKRFTKADVQFHSDHSTVRPAINIKWYGWLDEVLRTFRESDHEYALDPTDPDSVALWAWLDELDENPDEHEADLRFADECARESAYESFKEFVMETMGANDKDIWSEGRQGGWMVMTDRGIEYNDRDCGMYRGIDLIGSWDAIRLGKWAKCVRMANEYTKPGGECDYQLLWHLAVNVWEAKQWRKAEAKRQRAEREDNEMAWTMELLSA